MDYMQQYRRLAWNANGICHKYLKQFYKTVAMPRMLYNAEIWMKPPDILARNSQQFMSKMASVQRQAALYTMGALRTTPNDALNAHANLPPFDIAIHQALQCSTLQLATLPIVIRWSHTYKKL
jgi:hypothetical protein